MQPPIPQDVLGQLERTLGPNAWRLTPATFANHLSYGAWVPARHLRYISTRIATSLARGKARIIVSMPPRHGKSEFLSVWTPQWVLDLNPRDRIILTSYGADLSADFGRKARDLLIENKDNLEVQLSKDSKRVNHFMTTLGGGMYSVGIGGPITGRGANLLLVDDYLKNGKDAASETIRGDCYDWFISTALTRLEPGGSCIILATRWDIDDLIGRLLIHDPEGWDYIRFPAMAEEADVLGRTAGEPLWPERYGLEELDQLKRDLGTYYWQALFQQTPIPRSQSNMASGDLLVVDVIPHMAHLRMVRYWDFASTKDGGDYSVGVLLATHIETGIDYILDVQRGQWAAHDIEKKTQETAERDGVNVPIVIEQEPGSAGKNLIDYYQRRILKGYNVCGHKPTGDKFVRAQPMIASVQAGHMRLLRAPWNTDLVNEFESFPNGAHDDIVDGTSGAFEQLHGKKSGAATWGTQPADGRLLIPSGGHIVHTGATWGRR